MLVPELPESSADMTQKESIKQYIRDFGSISPAEAFSDLGITKLSTRIGEMVKDGETVYRRLEHGTNRYGKATRWMRYSMPKE